MVAALTPPAQPSSTTPSTPSSSVTERDQPSSTTPVESAAETTKPPTDTGITFSFDGQGGAGGASGNGGNGGTNSICVNCRNSGGIPDSEKIAIGTTLGIGIPAILIGIWGLGW